MTSKLQILNEIKVLSTGILIATNHVDLGHGVDQDDGENCDGEPEQEAA